MQLPKSIKVGDAQYSLNWSFWAGLNFYKLVHDDRFNEPSKIIIAIEDIYKVKCRNEDYGKAFDSIVGFYNLNKINEQQERHSQESAFCLSFDFDTYYSDFVREYNIDLSAEPIHWWTFQRLLAGLSDESMTKKIIGYRVVDTSKYTGEMRTHLQKMQELYKLPTMYTAEEKAKIDEFERYFNG